MNEHRVSKGVNGWDARETNLRTGRRTPHGGQDEGVAGEKKKKNSLGGVNILHAQRAWADGSHMSTSYRSKQDSPAWQYFVKTVCHGYDWEKGGQGAHPQRKQQKFHEKVSKIKQLWPVITNHDSDIQRLASSKRGRKVFNQVFKLIPESCAC